MHRARLLAVLACIGLAGPGCGSWRAAWRLGSTFRECEGQVLRVASGSAGARCLETQSGVDPGVRHFVQQNGAPDYVRVLDLHTVELAYIGDDRILHFVRRDAGAAGRLTVLNGIPAEFANLMTRDDRMRLVRVRGPGREEAVAP